MTFVRAWGLAAAALAAAACGSVNGAMSTGGGGGATSTGTTTSSTTGGAGSTTSSTTTTSSSSGAGGGDQYVPSGYTCSGKQPTLSADVIPIAKANCAVAAQCHMVDATAQGFWHYYVGIPSEECTTRTEADIAPGDPEHSYLINKITGKNLCDGFPSMPKGSALMSSDEIQTIYDWVCAGAKDD